MHHDTGRAWLRHTLLLVEAEITLNGGLDIRLACVGGFLEAEGGSGYRAGKVIGLAVHTTNLNKEVKYKSDALV
jgi:hypothetical protein